MKGTIVSMNNGILFDASELAELAHRPVTPYETALVGKWMRENDVSVRQAVESKVHKDTVIDYARAVGDIGPHGDGFMILSRSDGVWEGSFPIVLRAMLVEVMELDNVPIHATLIVDRDIDSELFSYRGHIKSIDEETLTFIDGATVPVQNILAISV